MPAPFEWRLAELRAKALPLTREVVLESLPLLPTTPLIFRETPQEPFGLKACCLAVPGWRSILSSSVATVNGCPYADRFAPELWTNGDRLGNDWPLVRFSEGPAVCPGRHLVLLLASGMIASVLNRTRLRLKDSTRLRDIILPATQNHFGVRFDLSNA